VGRRVQWYYRMVAPERGHGSWAEHAELIDAIEASDPERAQLLARKHTERTRDAYHRSLSSGRRFRIRGLLRAAPLTRDAGDGVRVPPAPSCGARATHAPIAVSAEGADATWPVLQGSLTTLTGSGTYGSFALSINSISPRSDMM
jgi:hypothetical protein